MRILPISLCLIFMVGCASYPKKNGFQPAANRQKVISNPYFSDLSNDYIYKANIEAFDKSFGGLLIVKRLGLAHHRIVLTTEMGNTLFDFTFEGDDFKVNRILKEMDRKILLNILKRDFKTLLAENTHVLQTFQDNEDIVYETKILSKKHYFYSSDELMHKIVRAGNGKEKVVFLFTDIKDTMAGNIQILHKTFPLTIRLKSI